MAEGQANPSFEGSWTDEDGEVWRRKGKRGRVLENRRVRALLRRVDVPLVIWRSFEWSTYQEAAAKLTAADEVNPAGEWGEEFLVSEWVGADGRLMMMIEQFCWPR